MYEEKKDELLHDHKHDGVDRQGFLKCVAWAGTGALCVMQGGVLKPYNLINSNAKRTNGERLRSLGSVQWRAGIPSRPNRNPQLVHDLNRPDQWN